MHVLDEESEVDSVNAVVVALMMVAVGSGSGGKIISADERIKVNNILEICYRKPVLEYVHLFL